MSRSLAHATGAVVFLCSTQSLAASLFTGDVIGAFSGGDCHTSTCIAAASNADAGPGSGIAKYRWGTRYWWSEWLSHSSSAFVFQGAGSDPAAPPAFSAEAGEVFKLGDFTYRNTPVYHASGVDSVDFSMDINLTGTSNHGVRFDVSLDILNTLNVVPNVPDKVDVASTSITGNQFTDNGIDYELQILGFSRDGGATFENGTYANEGETTTAGIYAAVETLTPVPIPGAIWLLGSGLLGLWAACGRR